MNWIWRRSNGSIVIEFKLSNNCDIPDTMSVASVNEFERLQKKRKEMTSENPCEVKSVLWNVSLLENVCHSLASVVFMGLCNVVWCQFVYAFPSPSNSTTLTHSHNFFLLSHKIQFYNSPSSSFVRVYRMIVGVLSYYGMYRMSHRYTIVKWFLVPPLKLC